MAVTLEGGCRVSQMREGDPVVNGTLAIWTRIGRAKGTQAISLRVMEFAPGKSPTIINDDCDQILYVLNNSDSAAHGDRVAVGDSGLGQIRGPQTGSPAGAEAQSAPPLDQTRLEAAHPEGLAERTRVARIHIDHHRYDINSDMGIYIRPNQTLAIEHPGSDSIVIISAQCPDPDRAPRFVDPPLASLNPQPGRAPIVRLGDQRAQPTADRWYRVIVDDEVGSTQATQFVGSIPPGRAPDHFHNYEEVLFILKGEGRMWAGESNTPIAAGSCIYLPKGQVHCVENTGDGELRLLGVFYPAGSPSVRYDV
jgi:mannose-6-phosphate isomerase-like protein (cupin superfamily)